jgi:hypothetical protein
VNIHENIIELDTCRRLDRIHREGAAVFSYVQIMIPAGDTVESRLFHFDRVYNVDQISDIGVLIRGMKDKKKITLWLPVSILIGSLDEHNRLMPSSGDDITYSFQLDADIRLSLQSRHNSDRTVFYGFLTTEDGFISLAEELENLNEYERRKYLKAVWFCSRYPADIWKYLVNGFIYDPRIGRNTGKRHRCQQCAYSWWMYFGYLQSMTLKDLYDIFQDELAYSIVSELTDAGTWKHGAWSDEMEIHTRFQLDGIQLLLYQYEKTKEKYWLSYAEVPMQYLIENLTESASERHIWFLHDTSEDLKKHHFSRPVFGSYTVHSYTVNTHIQALFVLAHLSQYSNKFDYAHLIEDGLASLKAILLLAPAERLYRFLVPRFIRHRLRGISGDRRERFMKLLEKSYITALYWFLRKRYPRIVYPNGLTERDLSITFMPFNYHVINIKDMLTLYAYFPEPWLESVIRKGFDFIRTLTALPIFKDLLKNSNHYIEVHEVFLLYGNLIEPISECELQKIKYKLFEITDGYSLDAACLTISKPVEQKTN